MIFMMVALMAGAAPEPTEPCTAQVLDYASWKETPDQQWDFRWPEAGPARLTIFGAEHLRTPEHAQFARIRDAFAEADPTIAFFEGPDRGFAADGELTIQEMGESGYIRFLARKAGKPVKSLEPSPAEQIAALLADHPADQVYLFFILREAARLRDRERKAGLDLDAAVEKLLKRAKPVAARAGTPLPFTDVMGLRAAAQRYWPGRNWRAIPGDWFSPLADDEQTGGRFLAAINRADSHNRNVHMVELLSKAVIDGQRPFVVVGRNHVPMQAPALACALADAPQDSDDSK